jgi:hypothetical protein
MARIDRRSQLKWASDNGAHHDLAVAADGTICALTREVHVVPSVNKDDPVYEDFVSIWSRRAGRAGGSRCSRRFEGSDYAAALTGMPESGDILHANGLSILDGRHAFALAAFRAGNLLVSLRSLNAVAILDPQSEKIVWALLGQWRAQHSPSLLANGRLLVFDNFAAMKLGPSRVDRARSVHAGDRLALRREARPGHVLRDQRRRPAARKRRHADPGVQRRTRPGDHSEGETVWEYVNPFASARTGAPGEP